VRSALHVRFMLQNRESAERFSTVTGSDSSVTDREKISWSLTYGCHRRGWHALRYSEGREQRAGRPRPSEYLRACHPRIDQFILARALRWIASAELRSFSRAGICRSALSPIGLRRFPSGSAECPWRRFGKSGFPSNRRIKGLRDRSARMPEIHRGDAQQSCVPPLPVRLAWSQPFNTAHRRSLLHRCG
jgi:hypothetical protein